MDTTKRIGGYPFEKYINEPIGNEEMLRRSETFYHEISSRRSVRHFSSRPVSRKVIDNLIKTACTAPSGAHKQPWFFAVVENPNIKREIRIAAEQVEFESYHGGMPDEWLEAIKPFQTTWEKPYLETAPYIIVVFKQSYNLTDKNNKKVNYYVNESVGIACGFLLAAIHQAGLVALTHTPNPMGFLNEILNRPKNEKPFLIIPVGHPDEDAYVPQRNRKEKSDLMAYF